jgi:mannose-6-phosphate isomerase
MPAPFELSPSQDKREVFDAVSEYLSSLTLRAVSTDEQRPWGGFFVIDESQTTEFINAYFPDYPAEQIEKGGKLSPKILIVAPGKRLSWQYHDRREELWRVVQGPVGICTSPTDQLPDVEKLNVDEIAQFGTTIRHRLVGLDNWGVVAEIWQHTDPMHPSDENDIVRVSDDFGR